MRRVMTAVICAVILLGTVAIGYAQWGEWRGGIRTRIHSARERIERGIENGSLTRREARRLQGELDMILAKIDAMRDDGRLSSRERARIDRDLDRLERHIRREKRDDDTRGGGYGRRGRY